MSKLIIPNLDNKELEVTEAIDTPAYEVADAGSDGLVPVAVVYTSDESESPVLGTFSRTTETNTNKAGVTRILVKSVIPCRAWAPAKGCSCNAGVDQMDLVDGESITVHTVITLPKTLMSNAKGTDVTLVTKALTQVDIALKAHLVHLAQETGYSAAAFSLRTVDRIAGDRLVYRVSALHGAAPAGSASLLSDAVLSSHDAGSVQALRRLITGTGSDDDPLKVNEVE